LLCIRPAQCREKPTGQYIPILVIPSAREGTRRNLLSAFGWRSASALRSSPPKITGGFSRRANPSEATPARVERTLLSVPFADDLEVGFDVEIDADEKCVPHF
jgi:hypothetical protein